MSVHNQTIQSSDFMICSGKSSCKWQYPLLKQQTNIETAANAKKCCHINKGHTRLYLYTFSIKTVSCDYGFGVGTTETSCLQLATSCYLQQNIPTPTPNRKLPSAFLACSHWLPQHSLLVCREDFGQLSCNLVVEPPPSTNLHLNTNQSTTTLQPGKKTLASAHQLQDQATARSCKQDVGIMSRADA